MGLSGSLVWFETHLHLLLFSADGPAGWRADVQWISGLYHPSFCYSRSLNPSLAPRSRRDACELHSSWEPSLSIGTARGNQLYPRSRAVQSFVRRSGGICAGDEAQIQPSSEWRIGLRPYGHCGATGGLESISNGPRDAGRRGGASRKSMFLVAFSPALVLTAATEVITERWDVHAMTFAFVACLSDDISCCNFVSPSPLYLLSCCRA